MAQQTVTLHSTAVPAMTLLGYTRVLAKPAALFLVVHLSNMSFALVAMMRTLVQVAGNTRGLEN